MISGKTRLDQYSRGLRRLAAYILRTPNVRLANIAAQVGDAAVFDKHMSTILTVLSGHNSINEQMIRDFHRCKNALNAMGFKLPLFSKRLTLVESKENYHVPMGIAAESRAALDVPFRTIIDLISELKLADDRNGIEFKDNIIDLFSQVKNSNKFSVSFKPERTSKEKNEFVNKRYDELATLLNQQVGSTAEGEKIVMYHLGQRPGMHFAIKQSDLPRLQKLIDESLPEGKEWTPKTYWALLDKIVENEAELAALKPIAVAGLAGDKDEKPQLAVKVVTLPFTGEQLDDMYPSLEIKTEKVIGPAISEVVLEALSRLRFSGFLEFDHNYRMQILWSIAPSDDKKNAEGDSYRDMLVKILNEFKAKVAEVIGMTPDVIKTKAGAAYVTPKPIGMPALVRGRLKLADLIKAINKRISHAETATGIERKFNMNIDDSELPYSESA